MIPLYYYCVKVFMWPFAPWRWTFSCVTLALKLRASGLFDAWFTITFVQRKNWNLHRWLSQNEGCLFRISWLVVVYAWKLNLSFCEISKRQRATQLNTRLSWCPFLYYKRSFNINIFTACWPIYQQAEFISRNMLPVLAWIIRRFH